MSSLSFRLGRRVPAAVAIAAVASLAIAVPIAASSPLGHPVRWRHGPVVIRRPPSYQLTSVSCASLHDCVAVGDRQPSNLEQGLAEHWDGTHWRVVQTMAIKTDLTSVSCTPRGWCMLIGGTNIYRRATPISEIWFKGRLHRVPLAPGRTPDLSSVSCSSPRRCMVVGQGLTGQGVWFGLAEVWNGTRWSRSALLNPTTNDQSPIVSCDSQFTCLVVGLTSDGERNFAMVWRHDTWRLTPPVPRTRTNSTCDKGEPCLPQPLSIVHDLSCASDGACVGVGDVELVRWDGVRWSRLSSPSKEIGLFGVSCPKPDQCVAVGFRSKGSNPLASYQLRGSTWSDVSPSSPGPGLFPGFDAIACITAHGCLAVGTASRPIRACGGGHCWRSNASYISTWLWDGTSWQEHPSAQLR